ncbi:hypothetical protein PIB30_056240 [Stylosanthes scabra]|uniref:Aminotransferase-like plant mobile domain-containing protein n=1 Tax=Stylosanthes scabra TaxID=79078 RepID=A0ABU6UK60_9FABA|nr:hypothetical protein [Stylosanthes scabra]
MAGQGGEQLERDADINRLDRTHHMAGAIGFQEPRTLAPRVIVPTMPPPDCLVPYIHEAGFGGTLQMRPFDYNMPLVSVLVERWRPETHSFHMPWGECTITLQLFNECRMWPIISDCAPTVTRSAGAFENSGCGMRQTLGRWPRNIWADVPRLQGEELCWGEDDLAEDASADDSGERGSARCAATVCPMLHHDDDRGRLVPRQDQQHRVAVHSIVGLSRSVLDIPPPLHREQARQYGDEWVSATGVIMDIPEISTLLSTRQKRDGVPACFTVCSISCLIRDELTLLSLE